MFCFLEKINTFYNKILTKIIFGRLGATNLIRYVAQHKAMVEKSNLATRLPFAKYKEISQ